MCSIKNIEVVDPKIINPKQNTMSTIAHNLSESLKALFPEIRPFITIDDDGNIEAAEVFVKHNVSGNDCQTLTEISEDYELFYQIKSTGATHGLVIEFNKQ
ncbi:hypothetical protein Peternella1_8 [Winogradskyella phage Peternella_1]|uniref:Uncharacterized protein n=1 Tax=Winogradskyella phage Peternella_1 TaxID=2745699 RepID=A0A8E4ZGK2_9CAUD|nr:hypothetical protein M1M32_gp08 [Winogradskyella phage Peternella_1]QQV91544.1 hypothetical protein Peternella1_8 [Winogradskyella phage Peternella_1]